MPDLHAVTTLFDWFRCKSVFISAAFYSLHHLLLSFLVPIFFFFPPLLVIFFCLLFDETSLHVVSFRSNFLIVV